MARPPPRLLLRYQKGSLVTYALQDYIGEATLNQALASYVEHVKFQQPPYTTSLELLDYVRRVTPPDLQYLLTDQFDTITLYDNRTRAATAHKLDDGKYEVKVKLVAKKMRAEGLGLENEIAMDDLVDVGAVDDNHESIFLEKRRIKSGESEVSFIVPRLPAKAPSGRRWASPSSLASHFGIGSSPRLTILPFIGSGA